MSERHRVWADIEAPSPEEAEYLLRDTLDQRPAIVYGATGKTWIADELLPDLGATLAADLLGAAVSEVDWYEIAGHLVDEVRDDGR